MRPDRVLQRELLFKTSQVLREAKVVGHKAAAREAGRRVLSVRTRAAVELRPPRQDLSPHNVLVLNLRPARPFECSLVIRLHCSTRAAGMTENDSFFSVLHFNQPRRWRGWQRVPIPAVNLVPTGFPDGWRNIETIALDFHSRHGQGSVLIGDIELMQVDQPRGPRMTDEELLEALDLDRPDLRAVARHAARGRVKQAVAAFAAHLRKAKLPQEGPVRSYPHYRQATADEICRNLILEQHLPRGIDWHANPVGYLEWGHAFNRHHWMAPLFKAFADTGRGRYAAKLDEFIRTWIEQNPEPVGHNGGLDPAWETLSTSIRINWAWGHVLRIAQKSRRIADRTLVDMAKMIHAHAEHLLRYHGHNNWYVSESAAVLNAAAMMPCFRRAAHWLSAATRRLQREMARQVFPDGVQFELSPGYHVMCADLFHQAYKQARHCGRRFSKAYERRLWSMFDFLAGIARPDGTYPVPNDAGCALRRGVERLEIVGRERRRADWLWAGSGGAEGRPPTVGSVHYADAGYAVMRGGWRRDDLWAFFDMGAFGASHQHEDKLQVELYAHGTSFLIDPGISSYQRDPVVSFFRTSDAHNTINIDGLGQCRRGRDDLRAYESSSRGRNLWAAGRALDFAQGCYDEPYSDGSRSRSRPSDAPARAGRRLEGIRHTRALVFVRPDYWLILDSVTGRGTHEVEAFWHFAPMHVRVDRPDATVRTNRLTHANMELICRGDWQDARIEIVAGRDDPVQGYVAIDQEVKPAPCAIVSRRKALPLCGVTAAVPYATGSDSHFHVETHTARGRGAKGMLISVRRPGGLLDRFLWRHTGKGAIEAGGIRSDGLLSCVRTDEGGKVIYRAIINGRRLSCGKLVLDGKPKGLVER